MAEKLNHDAKKVDILFLSSVVLSKRYRTSLSRIIAATALKINERNCRNNLVPYHKIVAIILVRFLTIST